MNLKDTLLDLLFPPKCPFCGKVTEGREICPACRKSLPWTEEKEAVRRLHGGVDCASALWYENEVREAVLRYKFRGAMAASAALGGLVAECAAERFSGGFDTVTWVPVGPKRRRQRGYDQSRLLAEAACRLWDARAEELLRKPVDNPPQSEIKDPAARRANVLGVYELATGAAVEGKHILLIDDILTTGATLEECTRMLTDAGAASVVCVTLAAARPRRDEKKETAQNT